MEDDDIVTGSRTKVDNKNVVIKKVVKDDLDLNGDGVVDKKDASVAGKILNKLKKSNKK